MGGSAAVIDQLVAGPDAGVGFVERQLVRAEGAAEQPALAGEVALDHRPDAGGVGEIAGPLEVAEKGVHRDEVHVVVVGLVDGEIAIRMERGLVAGEVEFFIGRRDFFRDGRGVLALRESIDVEAGAVVPAEGVTGVGGAPS